MQFRGACRNNHVHTVAALHTHETSELFRGSGDGVQLYTHFLSFFRVYMYGVVNAAIRYQGCIGSTP